MILMSDLLARIRPRRVPIEPYRCNAARSSHLCAGTMEPVATDPTNGVLFRCTACKREAYE